jgi:hypothetical protein
MLSMYAGSGSQRIECDEVWSFFHCKQTPVATAKAVTVGAGNCWRWTAIDPDNKLMIFSQMRRASS